MSVSRRDVLKSLSMGAAATSVLRVIPLQAAEYAHHMIEHGKGHEQGGCIHAKVFPAAAVQDAAGAMRDNFSRRRGFRGSHRGRCSGVYRPAHQRESALSVDSGRRPYVARLHLHRSLWQRLSRLHGAAEDGDARLHCVSQECGEGCEPEPGSRVLFVFAQPDRGWILYQQDWHPVFGLHREWLSGGISRLSAGARRLSLSRICMGTGNSRKTLRRVQMRVPHISLVFSRDVGYRAS